MSEDTNDTIRMKKDILSSHIPFIQNMLEKVKNTEFEKKWQQLHDCIMSDKRKLSLDQILKMNTTIVGLNYKMLQIEPIKENIQLKAERIEPAVVTIVQEPVINLPIKFEEHFVNTEIEPSCITKIEVSLENPSLSNDDITHLLVETAESTITQSVPIPAKVNEVVVSQSSSSGKIDNKKDGNDLSNTTKKPERLKIKLRSASVPEKLKVVLRSASVLIPSQSLKRRKQRKKKLTIDERYKKITIDKRYKKATKQSVSQNHKRRMSVCSSNSTKSYKPLLKKSPVEIKKVKEKTLANKIPVVYTPIDVPKTSELMLSLENLRVTDGLENIESIFVDSTDVTNNPPTSKIVKESFKRPKENSNLKDSSVKKAKLIEPIYNDNVGGKNVDNNASSPNKINRELNRLNRDNDNSFFNDSASHATVKRACAMKTIEKKKINSKEETREMKSCSVVLHRLQLSEQDMPFNINNLSLLNISYSHYVKRLKTLKSRRTKIFKNDKKYKNVKKFKKPKIKKYKKSSSWKMVTIKRIAITEDPDYSAGKSPKVGVEPIVSVSDVALVSKITQNIYKCNDDLPNNSELLKKLTSENPVITSNDKSTSPNIHKKFVDITLNNTLTFIISFKTVSNLSYAVIQNGTIYKCTCNDCKYQTFDQPSFVSHINEYHTTEFWHGFCKICNKTIEINSNGLRNFIAFEFIHMLDHVLNDKSPSDVVNLQNAENSKDSVASVNSPSILPKITMNNHFTDFHTKKIGGNIVGKIIPMIKVPMNCLMSAKQPKETVKSVMQPKPHPVISKVVRKPPSTSWTETVINAPTKPKTTIMHPLKIVPSNKTYVVYDNEPTDMLRPWIPEQEVTKSRELCEEMLTEICLSATFKCMGTTCSYYTSDEKLFRAHLSSHLKFQLCDKPNFTKCSYCPYQDLETENVIKHIKSSHTHDRYQCPYCFYRTIVDFNVLTHIELHHKMKRKTIIECNLPFSTSYVRDLEKIKKTRSNFVPPLICLFCKLKFYVFKTFISHINEHNEVFSTQCIKCNRSSTKSSLHKHLVVCHGFGMFQCVYCKYGTNTFEIISNHLTNLHPSKLPMFCERSQAPNAEHIPNSSIDSICLKHINQFVHQNIIKKLLFTNANLKNEVNVGNLSKNLIVRAIKPSLMDTNPNSKNFDKDDNLFDSNQICNQDQAAEPVLLNSDISSASSTAPKLVGEYKLKIKNVFSLSRY